MSRPAPAPAAQAECPWLELDADGSGLDVEDFLTFKLSTLGNAGQRIVTARYLEQFELRITEWRLLAALAKFSPISFGRLVSVSSSDKALVSRTLQAVVRCGLAVTEPDGENRKRVICRITPAGRALHRKILPVARRSQAELLLQLEPVERAALYRALHKLQRILTPAHLADET